MITAIYVAGEERMLGGLHVAKPGIDERWPVFGSIPEEEDVSESQWVNVNADHFVPDTDILDQDGQSSCCACATAQAVQFLSRYVGREHKQVAVSDLYRNINGGRDSGAALEDAVAWVTKHGVATMDSVKDRWNWRNPGYTGQSDAMQQRILRASLCPNVAKLASAMQRMKPVVVGMDVTNAWTPDENEIVGPRGGGIGGGHAILAIGMKRIGTALYFRIVNSWGLRWGGHGRAWVHSSWIAFAKYPPFSLSSIVDPSDDDFGKAVA
jgi:hypothetical protein